MAKSGLLERLGRSALDIVYPPRCVGCAADGTFLCDSCIATLRPATGPRCDRCWRPGVSTTCLQCQLTPQPYDGLRASYIYEGRVRELVHALKYRGMTALSAPLAKLCAESIESHRLGFDVVVPVPLHGMRQRTRGYNQSELLAKGIGAELGVPVDAKGLRRPRQTAQQARTTDIDQRRKNVEGAFRAAPSRFEGRSVCLVDDVTTTGATLAACSWALKQSGAKLVWAYALARED